MRKIEYYRRTTGREPARDWVNSKINASIRPSFYDRQSQLETENIQDLIDRNIIELIKGKGRKTPPIPGFYELKHKTCKWRMAVYHDQKRNTVILLHGWRKASHNQDAEIDKARTLLFEYMQGGT